MAGARILVVEDEGIVAEDLQEMLTQMGHTVVGTVLSGEEAVVMAHQTRPDLLIMDIRLNGPIDGIEAARQILQHQNVGVVYLTAYSDEEMLERAKATEPLAYLLKPIQPRGLRPTIEMALHKRELETRLRVSERRWATTLASIGDAVLVTDVEGRVTFMNAVTEKLTRWRQGEVVGQLVEEIFHIIHKDTRTVAANPIRQALREGRPVDLADGVLLIARDGTETPIVDCGSPIRDDQNQVTGCVLVFQDDSARRLAGEALRASEARLAEAQRIAHLANWELNLETGQAFWSEETYRQLGLEPGEIPATQEAFLGCVHPEDRRAVRDAITQAINERSTFEMEFRMVWMDGQVRYLRARGEVFSGPGGRAGRFVAASLDVTEHKRAEEERLQIEARLQHTQKLESLGVLAGGIAHDFNNILTSVLGYAELALLELPPGLSARECIEHAISGARRAAELTSQMLAYSGKGRFVIQPIHLSLLVQDMLNLFKMSISKKAVLDCQLADELPRVEADVTQLRQVVLNLIVNASEALGEQSGTIIVKTGMRQCDRAYLSTCHSRDDLPEGSYVYLEVQDTGCGMDQATLARLFEPFFTTKFTGRGLGLAAVQGIVRGHRGAIQVASEPGNGTRFIVLFPASSKRAASIQAPTTPSTTWHGSGTILIVDDEAGVRGMARHLLERLGFTVLTAVDGREAVEVYRANTEQIAAVLLDLTMPRLDGIETYHELSRIKREVRVILCSGFGEHIAERVADLGFAGFVAKPYGLEELTETLRRVLEGSTPEDSPK